MFIYEVKTYPSARQCIREAIGQLLEYSYYPEITHADHLVIVSQAKLNKSERSYVLHLSEILNISLSYIHFHSLSNTIIEQVNQL